MGGVQHWRQVLGLGPVDKEVGQCLGLDGGAWLVEDGVGGQLDGPFGHPDRCISVANDLGKWGSADNRDWVLLKVWLQFLGGKSARRSTSSGSEGSSASRLTIPRSNSTHASGPAVPCRPLGAPLL